MMSSKRKKQKEEASYDDAMADADLLEHLRAIQRRYMAVKRSVEELGMDIRLAVERAARDAPAKKR